MIAGWDGWRGSVYRLAVSPAHRRRGIGGGCCTPPRSAWSLSGRAGLHAIVVGTDALAVGFWDATNWEHQPEQRRYTWG